MKKIKVGIVGGTGYTGVELLRLLALHPQVDLHIITSRAEAGMAVSDLFSSLRGYVDLKFTDPAHADLTVCDLVFFGDFKQCTKTAQSVEHAFAHGFFGVGFDAFDQRITGVDVYTGIFVG